MPARLISIIYDEKTSAFVQSEHSQTEQGRDGLDAMDTWGDFSAHAIELSGLDDGNYTFIISADFSKDTQATFRLMKCETHEIAFETKRDLQPTIKSASSFANEYGSLCDIAEDEDESDKNIARAEKRMNEIENIRASDLEGVFGPHLAGNTTVNRGLLDMIDFLTYPIDAPYIPEISPAPVREEQKYRLS